MNDGVYRGYKVLYQDLPIIATESIMNMCNIFDVDSLEYLNRIQHADIIRK